MPYHYGSKKKNKKAKGSKKKNKMKFGKKR
jgi:hypothetical protein